MKFKNLKLIILLLLFNTSFAFSQDIKVYDFNAFKQFLQKTDDKVYVVNFWATWCKPCVKEMPAFNKLYKEYANRGVEIVLVSLDFGKDVQPRVKQFIKTHQIKPLIIILDDPDTNAWIDKVDKNWTGGIPATVIYNKSKRKFYEQSFEYDELEKELKTFL
ncbi:MAG TPA: TlpA disulfide reductase family protein [Bacteroidales bacterium]|nr:TlpA disulfide reductase family protein [Bacteroidales bacterium]